MKTSFELIKAPYLRQLPFRVITLNTALLLIGMLLLGLSTSQVSFVAAISVKLLIIGAVCIFLYLLSLAYIGLILFKLVRQPNSIIITADNLVIDGKEYLTSDLQKVSLSPVRGLVRTTVSHVTNPTEIVNALYIMVEDNKMLSRSSLFTVTKNNSFQLILPKSFE